MLNIPWVDCRSEDPSYLLASLRRKLGVQGDIVSPASRAKTKEVFGEELTPSQVVERICRDVQNRGLVAVLDYSARIDNVTLDGESIRVPANELEKAHRDADPGFLTAVRRIRANVERYQKAILHQDILVETVGGYLRERYRPVRRVAVCVPGGAAAYPSTLLMTVVPAQCAGVKEIAVLVPPTKFGAYNPDILATCFELGVNEVYRLGGAHGVAALAYGTERTPKVDKIVGPGNLFVALAKKYVFGEVDIDSIAGPSEVVVIVDGTATPEFVAFDLMAQAEHSPGSSVLIGWEEKILRDTLSVLDTRLHDMERGDLARSALEEFGAVILAKSAEQACELTNEIAPEHVHIATANPEALAERIDNAGAIFLGHFTPVALGDYAAGPSHVLPTGGTARFAGPLSANDFLHATSVLQFTQEGLEHLADDVIMLARREGLTAHLASVEIRRKRVT
ncbi:histidinol dehydrogenase [Thermogutta sp.]|jgi:histidinol dehydrogenase|uniref:histidinol dehydrogenase n=3 Tax=Thermogutta sp. TaxID=1962930 RepID=UPI003C7E7256